MVFLFVFLAGCDSWPDAMENIEEEEDKQYIKSVVNIAMARLEILEDNGADYCLPGQMNRAKRMLSVASRELENRLYLGAEFSTVELMDQLDYIAELMIGLVEGSECLTSFKYKAENKSKDIVHQYLDRLSDLLNCNCNQVTDEGKLAEDFQRRLKLAANSLNDFNQLSINIYASMFSEQVDEIVLYFSNHGARKNQVVVHYVKPGQKKVSEDGMWFEVASMKPDRRALIKDLHRNLRIIKLKQEENNEVHLAD
ncbi:hypothetical protein GZ77_13035 [Endozoicomonas montiporae]|uniref:Uncharacterized protein n=2 Tax=Endozoicomonas montiporae TaxID=1027273 RepID=A0A081N4G5_9GAMM|nr:hypothetical protein [Endozoicomonas montiporae]KEQ13338.1 hypothetical protein GZ77_13035 [Endozoicomonas montiporae]